MSSHDAFLTINILLLVIGPEPVVDGVSGLLPCSAIPHEIHFFPLPRIYIHILLVTGPGLVIDGVSPSSAIQHEIH